ncbi:hypothetical protein DBV15_08572 [Temnothorax longispinosus]|uniref:Uncharacterized protein n=1 Tax=Temnothorax longispinosus TaxID=300112 RepID=A0A4S2KZ30_9HYME|nr:hypothetical protein DBV15_08572 [Temnothorax longispinosus]
MCCEKSGKAHIAAVFSRCSQPQPQPPSPSPSPSPPLPLPPSANDQAGRQARQASRQAGWLAGVIKLDFMLHLFQRSPLLCMHHTNLSRTEFVASYQTNSDLQGRCRALTGLSCTAHRYLSFIFLYIKNT